MKKKGLNLDDPVYLFPKYAPSRGGATDIAFVDKSVKTEYRTMKTVVKNIYFKACVDRQAMRRIGCEITGRKNLVPLLVNSRILLAPFKMRKPLVRGDVCYGYANYFAIEEISEDGRSCLIRFFNGLTIPVLGSAASARKLYGDASLIAKSDILKACGCLESDSSNNYFYGADVNPASKSDIEELKRELWRIREVLGL